jgi:polyhydroxyalkanoate synthesis regulator phasin
MARKNTVTRFLSDIIDDTKDFVDDLIDRAKDAEEDLRDAVRNVVDDDEDETAPPAKTASTADLQALTVAVAELTATVNALAAAPTAPKTRTTKAA